MDKHTDPDGATTPEGAAADVPATGVEPGAEAQPTAPRTRRVLPWILSVTAGMLLGSSLFVLNYAEGLSYLSNDPRAQTSVSTGVGVSQRRAAAGPAL